MCEIALRSKRLMSENTINTASRNLGLNGDTVPEHAFRALVRTVLDEALVFRLDCIGHQIAHAVRRPFGRAYTRSGAPTSAPLTLSRGAQDDASLGCDRQGSRRLNASVLPMRRAR